MQSNSSSLLVRPDFSRQEYIHITPQSAGWEHLGFAARRMVRGDLWSFETGENELALVVLGGTCEIASNVGTWSAVGKRPNAFAGMPYTLYLPPETRFTVTAT